MKLYNLLLIVFVSILMPCMLYAGTAYYVDPSRGTNGNGSYASPWNNIPSVNNYSFSTGDDVYFKVNTTYTLTANSDRLQIDWGGTSGDRAIIGAYYGNDQFGLNGNSRPIFDGNNNTVPGESQPLISTAGGSDYVIIEYLQVHNAGGYGIVLSTDTDDSVIQHCIVDHSYRLGIGMFRGKRNVMQHNEVHDAYYWFGAGPCYDVSSQHELGDSKDNVVQYNVGYNCNEGIDIRYQADSTTVAYNVIYDTRYSIYMDDAFNTIVKHNLVYDTPGGNPGGRGVQIEVEEVTHNTCSSYGNLVFGNMIAGMDQGIVITCNYCAIVDSSCGQTNNLIYNNTLVDNDFNIRVVQSNAAWSGNEIKNNLVVAYTDGLINVPNQNPVGVTWSHNLFFGDGAVTGNAATNAVIGDPALLKTSGWRSLTADSLDGTEFSLTAASYAIDVGVSIAGYNDRITNADYTAHPISVTTALDSIPDIGAWKYNNGDTTPPAKPTGLIVVE